MYNKFKKISFCIITLSFILVMVEFISFTYFYFFNERYTFYDVKDIIVPDKKIEILKSRFDAELGWDPHYNTIYGERYRATKYTQDFISTFGDSFTHCDQVNNNETWQFYLSNILNKNVYNFGTGGFGTDQAYLRYKRDYVKVNTSIVALGLIPENINRIVNVYRPFYYPKTGTPMTKPRFIIHDDELYLLRNPIQTQEELIKLCDPHFIKKINNDYWSNNNDLPSLSFPYTAIFLNKHFYTEVINRPSDDINPQHNMNLWDDERSIKLMFKIFDAFINDARKRNATPIIMILPQRQDVIRNYNKKKIISRDKILAYCQIKEYLCFDGIESLTQVAHNGSEINSFYIGHVSAKGNEIIAKSFYTYLQKNKLVKEKQDVK